MENYRLNIFDAYGFIRADLDDKEVAKCPPEQLAVLMPLLEAWADTNAVDAAALEVEKAVHKASTALDKSRKEYEDALPKRTFHDEWRETVARLPAKPVDPEVTKKVKATLKAVEAAEKHLAECVAAVIPSRDRKRQKRANYTERLMAWSKIDGAPKNVGDLIKARSASERKIAMNNIAAGLPPDYAVAQASTVGPSHLDRFKAGQRKGGSANVGYNRNSMRGAQLQMKPASER